MASPNTGEKLHERSVQFLDWPYQLPILNPSDEWVEAENNLLRKHTPAAFLKIYGISTETYQSISKDLKDRERRAMVRAMYRGEHLTAAYKVIMKINRTTFDPRVRMSARWLAYACEETANMDDDVFELWARREGTKDKFENIANELRKERRACPSVLHSREQSNDLSAEQESLTGCPTDHRNDDDSDDQARASSPSPSETGSASSWILLGEDESHSEGELSISDTDSPIDAPVDSPEGLEHSASNSEHSTSQTSSQKDSHNTIPYRGDPESVDPGWYDGVEQEIDVDAEVHALQTEGELLQMQLSALEQKTFDLECSKELLKKLIDGKDTQLDSCHAEIQVLRNCVECLETNVDQLNKDLTCSREQGAILDAESVAKQDYLLLCNQEIRMDYASLREGMEHMWQDYLTIKGDLSNEQLEYQKTTDCLLEENEMLKLRCKTFENAFDHAVTEKFNFLNAIMEHRHENLQNQLTGSISRCIELGDMYERANDEVESLLSKNKLLSEELAVTQAENADAPLQLDGENHGSQADAIAAAGEHAELEEENNKCREEVKLLEKELLEAERQSEDYASQSETLREENRTLNERLDKLEGYCKKLEVDNTELEIELMAVQEGMTAIESEMATIADKDLATLSAELESVGAQNATLIAEKEKLKCEKLNLEDEMTQLGLEYKKLYEDHDKLNTVTEGLKDENFDLREEAQILKSAVEDLESANANLTTCYDSLTAKSATLSKDYRTLGDKVSRMRAASTRFKSANKNLNASNKDLKAENDDLKDAVDDLKAESQEQKPARDLLERDYQETMGCFDKFVKNTNSSISNLKGLLAHEKQKVAKLEEEKVAYKEMERGLVRLGWELHADHGRLIETYGVAVHALDDAESRAKSLAKDNETLRQDLVELGRQHESADDKLEVWQKFLPETAAMKATDLEKFMSLSMARDCMAEDCVICKKPACSGEV